MSVLRAQFGNGRTAWKPSFPTARKETRPLEDVSGGDLGSFRTYGHPYARIPEAIFSASTTPLSADAWKTLCYLIHRGTLSVVDCLYTRIETADLQAFIGKRCTVDRVVNAVLELKSAKFTIGDVTNSGIIGLPIEPSSHGICYYLETDHFHYPAPKFAGDVAYAQQHRYSLVDLRDVRKFTKVAHLRLYIFCQHARRIGERHRNNERWFTVNEVAALTGAAEGKRWGNVEQDNLRPAIFAVGKHAGMHIHTVLRKAKARGGEVIGVKFIVGSRFKDQRHATNAARERANRQMMKDRRFIEAQLIAAVPTDDMTEKQRHIVESVRERALSDWQAIYQKTRQRAMNFHDDGQFKLAVAEEFKDIRDRAHRASEVDAQAEREAMERPADWFDDIVAAAGSRRPGESPDGQGNLFGGDLMPSFKRTKLNIFEI